MRFKGLDLNLLVAFEAIMELRNVSHAAERLGLTQPAVSAALARLRDFFGDDLLVSHGRRMYPTPFAESLLPRAQACLQAANLVVVTSTPFDPATATRSFRIIASDYVVAAVLARLASKLSVIAPGISFEFILPDESAEARLADGEIDLHISPSGYLSPDLPREPLYEETYVAAGWRGNPLLNGAISKTDFLSAGHVIVSIGSHRTMTFGDRQLERMGLVRRIDAVASSFSTVPWLLIDTPRLTLMHQRLAWKLSQYLPISFEPLPFEFPAMQEMVQYHPARTNSDELRWLIQQIREASAMMDPQHQEDIA